MLNVILNLALFTVKFIGGKLSRSVSVTSDAFNNLTDAATTMFAWLGLKIAAMDGGQRHPNGHGRFEWVVALLSSSSIVLIGWELMQTSIDAIKNPQAMVFSVFTLLVLALSIAVKFFMFLFNRKRSVQKDSAALKAVSVDCLSDALSTAVVLISLMVNSLFAVNIDGWCGVLVALFIMYNGFKSFGETAERIIGRSAPADEIRALRDFAMENPDFADVAEVQIEDYGCGRHRVSMTAIGRAGISAEGLLADAADLKYRIHSKYGCNAQIAVEPAPLEDADIRRYIQSAIAPLEAPLKILSLRISKATGYKLAELDLGAKMMDGRTKNQLEAQLSHCFDNAPAGLKILARVKHLHETIRHRHLGQGKNKRRLVL